MNEFQISIHSPHTRGDINEIIKIRDVYCISIHSPHTRGDRWQAARRWPNDAISIHSPHTRGDIWEKMELYIIIISIHSPHTRGDSHHSPLRGLVRISIRSPLTRGDSISLQKSIRIYVSLHNKTMIHRFSELYKPFFAAQSPIFGVRNPRKSRDSFTFARPSDGRGITP